MEYKAFLVHYKTLKVENRTLLPKETCLFRGSYTGLFGVCM